MSALSALPATTPAYHLVGDLAHDPVARETLRLVSFVEQHAGHEAAAAARKALDQRGVLVPERRGQLPLRLAGSTTAHYDAIILAQEDEIVAYTPQGFGPQGRRKHPPRHHVLHALDAREKVAAFEGVEDAFLCMSEFHGWRRRKLLRALNALYVDVDFHDTGEAPSLDLMKEVADQRILHLQRVGFHLPTLRVFTGRGFHLYWSHGRLPESELARWAAVQEWLQSVLDSDPAATDATRYLRLVGSRNSKTGTEVSAERVGPAYTFESLYRTYLFATGRPVVETAEDDIADEIAAVREVEDPEYAATGVKLATVFDINVFNARNGRRATTSQAGIHRWFDLVYRDIRLIIEHRGWKGAVPEGQRNILLFHLAVALAWFTEPDALADEIRRENALLIGLPARDAEVNTRLIVEAAHATARVRHGTPLPPTSPLVKRARMAQLQQAKWARAGEFRYGASRQRLWRDLRDLIPADLVPSLRAIIPDDIWRERQRERQRARDRVAEGRYQFSGEELRRVQQQRRELALTLRAGGYGWEQVGAVLQVTASAARMLAGRA